MATLKAKARPHAVDPDDILTMLDGLAEQYSSTKEATAGSHRLTILLGAGDAPAEVGVEAAVLGTRQGQLQSR